MNASATLPFSFEAGAVPVMGFGTSPLRGGMSASAKRSGLSEQQVEERSREEIPAKRFGTAQEFGQTCAFLCSVHAGYITGQNIVIDGGRYPAAF